jgi:hypothetical protein
MIEAGWYGQTMADPDVAENYILLAANNVSIANELPEAGFRFWRACKFQYDLDKARKKFGRPPRERTARSR